VRTIVITVTATAIFVALALCGCSTGPNPPPPKVSLAVNRSGGVRTVTLTNDSAMTGTFAVCARRSDKGLILEAVDQCTFAKCAEVNLGAYSVVAGTTEIYCEGRWLTPQGTREDISPGFAVQINPGQGSLFRFDVAPALNLGAGGFFNK